MIQKTKQKTSTVLLSLVLILAMVIQALVPGQIRAAERTDVDAAVAGSTQWMIESTPELTIDGTHSWFAMDLARTGADVPEGYLGKFYEAVAADLEAGGGKLTNPSANRQRSEYSRTILALTALGYDARDVGGYNLFDMLSNLAAINMQGLNGTIWALVAYNSNPAYDDPDFEAQLVDTILNAEIEGGGWALRGNLADSDMTGMALYALAPYYHQDDEVTAAIDRGLTCASEKLQMDNGAFGTFSSGGEVNETSESISQIIVALCELGINPDTDTRFIKNGSSPVDALMTYYTEKDGKTGFMHTKTDVGDGSGSFGEVNAMATYEAVYALNDYQRLLDDQNGFFDMSDVNITGEEPTPEVDKSALQSKVDEAKAIAADGYTEDSYKALSDAIAAAEVVLNDADATQENVDAQVSALQAAIDGLDKVEEPTPGTPVGTVSIDVERFTVGQGWLIEPVQVPIYEGENTAQLVDRFLKDNGYKYTNTGTPESNFYLASILEADTSVISVPDYIVEMSGGEVTTESCQEYQQLMVDMGMAYTDNALGEFSYTNMSGWYYFVNNEDMSIGMSGNTPKDGDVIRLQFTLYGYGADLTGYEYGAKDPSVVISDKDAAIKAIAAVNSADNKETLLADSNIKAAYDTLKEQVEAMVTDQAVLDASVKALEEAVYQAEHPDVDIPPESITLNTEQWEAFIGEPFTLTAAVEPEDADDKTVTWSTSDAAVADVDSQGKVTPKAAGEAIITAKTVNGLTDTCTVTVKDRGITGITLNATALNLTEGATASLKAAITPADTTTDKTITWASDNPDVAEVSADGVVTAKAPGSAVITASTVNGKTAQCTVTVAADTDALVDAVIAMIDALPDSGSLTLEHRVAVMSAKASYDALPEAQKAQIDDDRRAKLDNAYAIMTSLAADADQVQAFEETLDQLLNIEQIDARDNDRVKAAVNLYNIYDGLTGAQKEQLSDAAKERAAVLESTIARLKDAVEAVNDQIRRLSDSESLTLADQQAVADAWTAYNSLCPYLRNEEYNSPDWIIEQAYTTLINADKQIKYLYTEAIQSLDPANVDLGSDAAKTFIQAVIQYENTDQDLRPVLSEDVTAAMETGKTAIAAKAHTTDDGLSAANLPWYVALETETVTPDSSFTRSVEATYGEGSTIRTLFSATLRDLSTGTAYVPESPVTLTLACEKGEDESADAYKLFRADSSTVNGLFAGITRLAGVTIEDISGMTYDGSLFTFETSLPCVIGTAYTYVPMTGITISGSGSTVSKGSTLQLSVSAEPANATDAQKGLDVRWFSSDTSVATVDGSGRVTGVKVGKAVITATVTTASGTFSADYTIEVTASAAAQQLRDSLNPSISTMLKTTSDYVLRLQMAIENEAAGNIGYGSSWEALAVGRARDIADSVGIDTSQYDAFINTYYNNVAGNYKSSGGMIDANQDGRDDGLSKRTEYSKLVLAMTAIGKDATNIEGYNLFDHLRSMDEITIQGNNGPIWALLAYKCSDAYADELPATQAEAKKKYPDIENPVSEEALVEYILDIQIGDGGWTLKGDTSDSDMTGMAMQALWPYYGKAADERSATENKYADRTAQAVKRGFARLSQLQTDNGAFTTINGNGGGMLETSESTAQVIVAASMLGEDVADSSLGLIKGSGQWALSGLTAYYSDGSTIDADDQRRGFAGVPGGFAHTIGNAADDGSGAAPGTRNGMATQQGFYSLVAYQRLVEGRHGLYDMRGEDLTAGSGASGNVNASAPAGSGYGSDYGGGNASGGSATGRSGGGTSATAATQPGSDGWNFDAAMAAGDRAGGGGGLDADQLKLLSGILGGSGIAGFIVYCIIMGIVRFLKRPVK